MRFGCRRRRFNLRRDRHKIVIRLEKMIAVTGAGGFIGSHVVELLTKMKIPVLGIDKTTGIDITDDEIPLDGCSAVIHLAGVLGTSELFDSVENAINVNVHGTRRVLESAVKNDVSYVGITMPDVWPSVYQATKLAGVRLAAAFNNATGLPVTHIRAFNVFGKRQPCGDHHPAKILPTFATASWRGAPMPIYGNGYQTVDLVSADHVANCLVLAAVGRLSNAGKNGVWDAGSGIETPVTTVAAMVGKITGNDSVALLRMRHGELPDTKLAASEFGPLMPYVFDYEDFVETVNSYR